MRTKLTIMALVLVTILSALAVLAMLLLTLGPWTGLALGVGIATVVVLLYRFLVRPWHSRWGTTTEEAARRMPGDVLFPAAPHTTRAVTIQASPEEIWPWLVQIGYGRAGWYSYDWIDNDGRPSAERVVPELQSLSVGDQIVMVPGMGPHVLEIAEGRYILSGSETDSWCLALYPADGGTRLVSRWRAAWPRSLGTYFWIAISDPGAFIMERKMLLGIKRRAEAATHVMGRGRTPPSLRAVQP